MNKNVEKVQHTLNVMDTDSLDAVIAGETDTWQELPAIRFYGYSERLAAVTSTSDAVWEEIGQK